jgi:hypothetical protein
MAEESTRKLLKLFGIAVSDFEDQTQTTLERLGALGPSAPSRGQVLELAVAWLKVSGEALARWQEMGQLLMETHARGQAELVRVIAGWREPPEA